jgi:hypothetical protein
MPAAAGAQGNIKFGNLEVKPFVSTQETYDSNIYLTGTQRKSASINRSALGVDLVENIGSRYDLKAGYNMELLGYSRETSVNNAVHHGANIGATGKLPKSITVMVEDKWKQTTDQSTSQTTERAKRVENAMNFNVNAPIRGKFGFAVALQHIYNNYIGNNPTLDREDFQAGFDVDYKWQPKTKLFMSYRHGMLSYQTGATNDATYDNVDLGITGKLLAKLTGTVKAGMQTRNYDEDLGNAKNSATTAQYSAQAVWKAVENTEVTAFAKRGNVETNYGDARFYTSTLTDLSVTRQVRKVKVGLGINYEDIRYSDKNVVTASRKRLDENAGVRLTAEYNIQKWLVANFAYNYKDRSSNFDTFEYKDNMLTLGLKATF